MVYHPKNIGDFKSQFILFRNKSEKYVPRNLNNIWFYDKKFSPTSDWDKKK